MHNGTHDHQGCEQHHVLVLEQDETGAFVPVPVADLPDFTQPPEGMARPARRRWKRCFDDLRTQYGMPLEKAWYHATAMVIGR